MEPARTAIFRDFLTQEEGSAGPDLLFLLLDLLDLKQMMTAVMSTPGDVEAKNGESSYQDKTPRSPRSLNLARACVVVVWASRREQPACCGGPLRGGPHVQAVREVPLRRVAPQGPSSDHSSIHSTWNLALTTTEADDR